MIGLGFRLERSTTGFLLGKNGRGAGSERVAHGFRVSLVLDAGWQNPSGVFATFGIPEYSTLPYAYRNYYETSLQNMHESVIP